MQQLAKECLEIHKKIKKLLPRRQDKGDKLAEHVKSQLLNYLVGDEEDSDIDVWCNSVDDCFDIYINIPIKEYVSDHIIICYSCDDKKWGVYSGSKCRFDEIMTRAQSIVDKLNGKEW